MKVEEKIEQLLGEAQTSMSAKQSAYLKSILKDKDMKMKIGKLEGALKSVASKHGQGLILSATNIIGEPYVSLGDEPKPDTMLVKDVESAISKAGFKIGKKAYNNRGKRFEIMFGNALRKDNIKPEKK